MTQYSKAIHTYYDVIHLLSCSLVASPLIVKFKFGDYTTLDALAEQWRVQRGTFDPRVLMDRSPSKAKIHHHLMMEKVMDRIEELEKPHLKLVVLHDFMWAFIEEQASNKAHQLQAQDQRL